MFHKLAFLIFTYLLSGVHLTYSSNPLHAPFSTQGNQIVNALGQPVRLMGVSWYGFETDILVPHGLWTRNWKELMNQVKALGFNVIRIPFCNQMFDYDAKSGSINYHANPDLVNLSPVQILDKIVSYADEIGLYIILDRHRSSIGGGPNENGLWYTAKYTENRTLIDWRNLARRYKNNYSVIGADIHNEPKGQANWGSNNLGVDWHKAAQKIGNVVLAANPNLLILVEGIEVFNGNYYWWGGNLMGVKSKPVELIYPNKVVYSPHDYPNSIHPQSWFSDPSYPNNLPSYFKKFWGYIFEENIAPVVLGEFGSRLQDPKDIQWFKVLTAYMNGDFNNSGNCTLSADKQGVSWLYWSLNPESSDTGGILQSDWRTPEQQKLTALAPIMKQNPCSTATNPSPTPTPSPNPNPNPPPVVRNPLSAPFSTKGNQIVNAQGQAIRLIGVNWFGFETATMVPHGLWSRNYKDMMDQIKSLGFNVIRLPYCNQMFDANSRSNSIDFNLNPDLNNLTPLQIMDKVVAYADQIGLFLILDHHRSEAGDGPNFNGLWYTDQYPETRMINDWKMLVTRYKNNVSVIAADLHNEPYGSATWGSNVTATDWRSAAQRIGNSVLSVNPNLLIIVEGIENYNDNYYWWGGNLMGVQNSPVTLTIPNKVVYSPHDYPKSVYAQPWFNDPSFPSNLPAIFSRMWGYIFQNNIAPVLIGEFGTPLQDQKDIQWLKVLSAFMNGDFNNTGNCTLGPNNAGISWTFWSFNPDSGDTGGILMDDWKTANQQKLNALASIMKQNQC